MDPMQSFSPDRVFSIASALAMSGWLALALSPPAARWAGASRRYAGRVVPLVLAVAYVALIVRHWGPGGFGSLAAVRELFAVPGLLAAGWLHYLAFDLFIGTWIAERCAGLGVAHIIVLPLLALTFLFGPAGLLAFAAVRLVLMRRSRVASPSNRSLEARP
jgi:hypothetical protein